jgi:hypothetical protein
MQPSRGSATYPFNRDETVSQGCARKVFGSIETVESAERTAAMVAISDELRRAQNRRPTRLGTTDLLELLYEAFVSVLESQARADIDATGVGAVYARAVAQLAASKRRRTKAQVARRAARTELDAPAADALPIAELTVESSAAWFRIGAEPLIDCSRFRNVRRALLVLIEAHRASHPRSVSWRDLVGQIWPGDLLTATVAKNRVRVTMAKLRKLGLSRLLFTYRDGYRLGEGVVVRTVDGCPRGDR